MLELAPWKPIGTELSTLKSEMDRLLDDFFGDKGQLANRSERGWLPAIDLSETKDAILVKADIPGIDPKDMDVSLQGDLLVIRGERKEEKEEKDENFHRVEIRRGAFTRSIRIPVAVDADRIEAKYENGVLKIKLPKKEEIKPKQIEIKSS